MKKICPICNHLIQDNDIVVVLLLSRFRDRGEKYDLELMAQTISSHLYCADQRKTMEVTEAK